MPLDYNLFLRGAEMNRQRDADMWNSANQAIATLKEDKRYEEQMDLKRKELESKGFDIEKLAQSAVMKSEMGVPLDPTEKAGFEAYQKFEAAKLGQNPVTGDLYPKYRAFDIGAPSKGFDVGKLSPGFAGGQFDPTTGKEVDIGNMGAPAYAPATNDKPLSMADLGIPAMDASQLEGDALPKVEYLPPLPADAQGFNMQAITPENNLRLPTPSNPVQEKANYEAQLDIAKSAAKSAQDINAAGQKKLAESAAEKEANRPKAEAAYKNVLAKSKNIDTTIDKAINMVNPQTAGLGSQIKDVNIPFTGINVGAGSKSKDLEALLSTIGADSAFSELQAMRDASPTGGALGSITERELSLLQNAVAALDQAQSPEQLKTNLANYKKTRKEALDRVRQAYDEQYGGGQSAPTSGAVSYEEYFK